MSRALKRLCTATEVFFTTQGTQGLLGKPSKQQLDNVFETHNDMEVIQQILERGRGQNADGIRSSDMGGTNMTIGSMVVDTRGKGLRGVHGA